MQLHSDLRLAPGGCNPEIWIKSYAHNGLFYLVLSCLIHAVAGRTSPAGERGSAAGSLLSSHCPNYTWALRQLAGLSACSSRGKTVSPRRWSATREEGIDLGCGCRPVRSPSYSHRSSMPPKKRRKKVMVVEMVLAHHTTRGNSRDFWFLVPHVTHKNRPYVVCVLVLLGERSPLGRATALLAGCPPPTTSSTWTCSAVQIATRVPLSLYLDRQTPHHDARSAEALCRRHGGDAYR
jgi:hypothetical protein